MMSLSMFAAMLLQTLPAPAAATWEPVGSPRDGVASSIDPASIARTGDSVTFHLRSEREAADPEGMKTAILGFTMDCRARTAVITAIELYKADGSFGRAVPAAEFDNDPQPIGNDPNQRAVLDRACRAAPGAAAPAATPAGH